ncbi:GNAT family N-acetyltransferase [Rhizobium leguminosarum bv. viciae]|nr:GNAT family N-acetyltransferase [Rhizobium leguminosarum bv. viciae]
MFIRDANADDTAAMLRLLRQIAACSNDAEHGPGSSDEQLLGVIENCRTFVLGKNDQLIGINAVRIVDLSEHPRSRYRKMAFIMALGVEDIERRRGYGAALFDHMRKWLSEEEVDLISLNVSASNEAAQAFFRRMGLAARSVQMDQSLKR